MAQKNKFRLSGTGTVASIGVLIGLPFVLLIWLLVQTANTHIERYEQMNRVLDGFRCGLALIAPLETMRDLATASVYLDAPDIQARYAAAHDQAAQQLPAFLAALQATGHPSLDNYASRLQTAWNNLVIDSEISNATVPFETVERFNNEVYATLAPLFFVSDMAAGEKINANELLMVVLDTGRKVRRELGLLRSIAFYTARRGGFLGSLDAEHLDNAWSALDTHSAALAAQLENIQLRYTDTHINHSLQPLESYLATTEETLILMPEITIDSETIWNDGERVMTTLRAVDDQLVTAATLLVAEDRRARLRMGIAAAFGLLLLYAAIITLGVLFYRTHYAAVHAEADNRAKGMFLARMSHEIRTPLNGVIGLAELLADTGPTPLQSEYIDLIRSAGKSLVSLVNDILDHAKIEAGKLTLEQSPFDIRTLIHESAQVFGLHVGSNQTLIFCTTDSGVPALLTGDPMRIRQILLNLIANAVKFTEHGRIDIHAELATSNNGEKRLRIEVRDTGIGLTPAEQQTLFNLFTQASPDVAKRFGGTGLGLSISRELVRLMHGNIGVYSGVGAGSVFWFELPLLVSSPTTHVAVQRPLPALPAPVLLIDADGHLTRAITSRPTHNTARLWIAANEVDARQMLALHTDIHFVVINAQRLPAEATFMARQLEAAYPAIRIRLLLATGTAEPDKTGTIDVVRRSIFTPGQLLELLTPGAPNATGNQTLQAVPAAAVLPTGLRVLVVEDNAVNQLVTRGMLRKLGVETELAADGRQAVDYFHKHGTTIDLVLMDLDMPVLDGSSATREIRLLERERKWPRCPILALSAHALPEYGILAREAGMDGQIVKPVTLATLGAALLQHYRPRLSRQLHYSGNL